MALSKIKTNTQKRKTKGEPQTNGSYKIRQIIIKIIQYTYTPISKIKAVQQVLSTVDWNGNKGNQKLYLPVKNKTKAQTGRQT